jgi:hypothetical protein
MLSKSLKRKIAVLLTGVMVFGMTLTAWADPVSGTAVESQGTGNFEGHVNRKVVDVTLPTVSENTSPFSFIYDAEGLIPETKAAAYGSGYTFPESTHVYFKTADKTFGADSTEFTVSNNSSVSVNIALKIEMEKDANAPELVATAGEVPNDTEAATADAKLFLGLVVGGDATGAEDTDAAGTYAVSENTVEKTFNLLGEKNNYSVSTNQVGENADYPHTYEFKKKADANPNSWKKITFKLTGKANKVDNAEGKTAPNLKVTWNFAALDDEAVLVGGGSSSSGGSTTPEAPTTAFNYWDDGVNGWWIYKTEDQSSGFDSNTLTNAKIDGEDVSSLCSVDDENWIALTYSGVAASKYEAGKKTFTFEMGGTKYTTELE